MIYSLRLTPCLLFLFIVLSVNAQKSLVAKKIHQKTITDSAAKKYTEAADGFAMAAKVELKIAAPDVLFVANCFYCAASIMKRWSNMQKGHEVFYLSMDQYRNIKSPKEVSKMKKAIVSLYQETQTKNVVYQFPRNKNEKTILAYLSIESIKNISDNSLEALIDGGSNDGVYEGAETEVYGKYRRQTEYRANRLLGSARISE